MMLFLKTLVFLLIPAIYYVAGWVNWQQTGMIALLGAAAVMMVAAWTTYLGARLGWARFWLLLTVFPFFVCLGFQAFLRDFFGVGADEGMVFAAIFSSDHSESLEFIKHYARPIFGEVIIVAGFTAGYTLFLYGTVWKVGLARRCARRGWALPMILTSVFLLLHLNESLRRHNPLLSFPLRYASWSRSVENMRLLRSKMAGAATDAQLDSVRYPDSLPRTVVFVLGESVTRHNFSTFGYPRKTTPELEAMGDELIWFSDIVSSDATTIPSLTKILTPATLAQPDLWTSKPDILMMARKAGYKTFWISNHGTDLRGVASLFMKGADQAVVTNRGDSRGEGSHDEVVLPILAEALRDPSPRKFILVHLLNAHPAYYFRYPKPFARFNDVNDTVAQELKAAGRAFWAINNRDYYDNAILYSDTILKQSIELCRASAQPIAWLYAPDHGEDVAHYSNFCGHNAQVPSQYEVPMIYWRSASFPSSAIAVAELRRRPYQMDYLDHTLLGLMGIVGDYYEPERDIFSSAFKPWLRSIRGDPYPGRNLRELDPEPSRDIAAKPPRRRPNPVQVTGPMKAAEIIPVSGRADHSPPESF